MSDYFDTSLLGIPLFTFICAGVGTYAGAYLKKRGENLATKDDFDELRKQTATLTLTTKEIESRINDQVWNRQRLWEMKRDILFDATKHLTKAHDAIAERYAIKDLKEQLPDRDWSKEDSAGDEQWRVARANLDESISLAVLVCRTEVVNKLTRFRASTDSFTLEIAGRIERGTNDIGELKEQLRDTTEAIRYELETTNLPTSQST